MQEGGTLFHQVWLNEIARGRKKTLCYFLPKQDTALVVIVKERDPIIHLSSGILVFT